MSKQPDLHTHSTSSDGTLSPDALVAHAAERGVEVMALTDHDTTEGVAAAAQAGEFRSLALIPGVEVSTNWGGRTVHILGLRVDPASETLQAGLNRLQDHRMWRAEEIGRRLAKAGIEGAYRGARALSNGHLVGRTHFARYLIARGYAQSLRDLFKHYLVKGKPGHVEGKWATLEETVGWIRAAGGQAVIAHPARYRFSRTKMLRMIGEFKELGGDAIEVISGSHSRDDAFVFARHARENDLFASTGSDFHGPISSSMGMGRLPSLPEGCTPIWRDWELDCLRPAATR